MSSVCFYCNEFARLFFDAGYKRLVNKQRWFTSGKHYVSGRLSVYFFDNFVGCHFNSLGMLCVAERAFQVAARKPDKHSGSTGKITFTLKAVKNFVDFKFHLFRHRYKWLYFLPIPGLQLYSIPEFDRKSILPNFRQLG